MAPVRRDGGPEAAGCCWSTKEQKCYLSSVGGTSAALWIIDEARHDSAEQRTYYMSIESTRAAQPLLTLDGTLIPRV